MQGSRKLIWRRDVDVQALGESSPAIATDRLFIGGEWVASSGQGAFEVISPSTEALYMTVAEATADDVDRSVAAARHAFDHGPWSRMTPQERAPFLRAIADGIAARGPELGSAWTSQVGVLTGLANYVSVNMADMFRSYADMADSFAFEERRSTSSGAVTGLLVREPVGVVAAIIP